MALYNAQAVLRVAIRSNPPGSTNLHVNVLHFARRDNQSVTNANLDDLEANLAANMKDEYLGLFYTDHTGFIVDISTVYGSEKIGKEYSWGTGSRVHDNTDIMPEFTAYKISWLTGYREKRYKGRTYLGGLREPDNTSTVPSIAYDTQVNLWLAAMNTYFQDQIGGYVFVILSDPDKKLPLNIAVLPERVAVAAGVEGAATESMFRTLRRRMPGVGA